MYGDHDFLPLEAMSEDETDTEETLTLPPGWTMNERGRQRGRAVRVPWRSRELEEAIAELDRRIKHDQGENTRRARSILYGPTAEVPTDPNDVEPISALTYRWMVAQRYRDRFPAAVTNVQLNREMTEANIDANVVRHPTQWGQEPRFELVTTRARSPSVASRSSADPSEDEDDSGSIADTESED